MFHAEAEIPEENNNRDYKRTHHTLNLPVLANSSFAPRLQFSEKV